MARRAPKRTSSRAPVRMKGATVPKGPPGALRPPTNGAPPATPPIETRPDQNAVAPWPLNDRYPLIIGVHLTEGYLASVFRLAITGYRQQFVDLLDELLEHDPHVFSVLQKRIISTANGRMEVRPFEIAEDDPDYQIAQDAAAMVQSEIDRIPNLTQSIASLLWGLYYGVSASEIMWSRDSDGWHIDRLQMVHSRRLAYPDMQSWSLYVWDQGQVYGWQAPWGESPTNSQVFGTRIADWPGKFITYCPQLRGDYPTREGIGRQIATWVLFKRAGVRGAMAYLERFAKGFMDGTYSTQDDGKPREATPEDIAELRQALAKVGPGSGSFAMHADSVKLDPKGYEGTGTAKVTYQEWIGICDSQISKATLGGTLGTEVGGTGGGNRSLGEVQERGEVDLEQYDATTLAECFRKDIIFWLVRLNMPAAAHVMPHLFINVDREPDAKTLIANAKEMTEMGLRVDGKKLSDETGVALIPSPDDKPVGTFHTDFIDPSLVYPDLMSDEAKQQKQDATDAQQKLAEAKAAQPTVIGAPGGNAPPGAGAGKQPSGVRPKPGASPKAKDADKATDTDKSKPDAKAVRASFSDEERADDQAMCLLLKSMGAGKKVAQEVYDQLLEDYPANSLGWILSGHWTGPVEIPTADIDFSEQHEWRASHEPIQPYVDRIESGKRKPVVLVQTPGNPKALIVDGHHRSLASKELGIPVLAYIAKVHVDDGPWLELHSLQKRGSSKGSWSISPAQQQSA
jgi:phage gp29-like protein